MIPTLLGGVAVGLLIGATCWCFFPSGKPKSPTINPATVQNAFHEGRESMSGTDRHHADNAWRNSRARARVMETLGK